MILWLSHEEEYWAELMSLFFALFIQPNAPVHLAQGIPDSFK